MVQVITKRRICWPNPDATCLQGGCGYCNGYPYRALTTIRRWAEREGKTHHRHAPGEIDALDAYLDGLENDFFNADTK